MGVLIQSWVDLLLKSGPKGWILLLSLALITLGSETLDAAGNNSLVVTADSLEMDQKQQTAVFSGNVVAEDGNMRITSDRMRVNYVMKSQTGRGRGSVREVKAEGHVAIDQGENRGEAQSAIYNVAQRTLELIGGDMHASIQRGKDHLEGKRILLTLGSDMKIDKVSVQGDGGKKRVSARITPSGRVEGDGAVGTLPDLVGMERTSSPKSPPPRPTEAPKRAAPKEAAVTDQEDPNRPSHPQTRPLQRPAQELGN
ncbi:MAG: hypothetical protein HQL84_14730 [Magnetococcales bacterium]|nr:hypothetical protein [Magnetococcales bacterium]MBF0151274.1 hypothetical protein [Magnetococcales bacterium]